MTNNSVKLVFQNRTGHDLAGRLELPADGWNAGTTFAIFAHCFTCSKDVFAASRISRALSQRGIAVLRFDFTGLGGSDGDFANTNFSSNVADLISAADHLRANYAAPSLLIGHSLGGAAVLAAARQIPEVRAVSTIGAPADPAHVSRLFAGDAEKIKREGVAEVQIGGRSFNVAKQFLDDLDDLNHGEVLGALKLPLLLFHSPIDSVVGIDNARMIYQAARGPKSFVTLDDADHLLTEKRDSQYVADVLSAWASRYLESGAAAEEAARNGEPLPDGQVRVEEIDRPYTNRVTAGPHVLTADEPARLGGQDRGPDPYSYLLAGLGACTSITLRMYADRKQWPLTKVSVTVQHARIDASECESCESDEGQADQFVREIRLEGPNLSDEQRERLLEIANRCPVHRTLLNQKEILSRLV